MSKKLKYIAAVTILLAAVSIVAFTFFQRQYQNIFLEMIIHPPTLARDNSRRVYRFIVKDDGTFISYSGISIDHRLAEQTNMLMWPVARRRSSITLADDDFQNISEMASILSSNQATFLAMHSQWEITLLHNGNIHHSGLEFYKIAGELMRLSPLTLN